MKKAILISFTLILGCSDGPDIILCFIGTLLTDTVCIEFPNLFADVMVLLMIMNVMQKKVECRIGLKVNV